MKRTLLLSIVVTAALVLAGRKSLIDDSAHLPTETPGMQKGSISAEGIYGRGGSAAAQSIGKKPFTPADPVDVTSGSIRKRSSFFVEMQKAGVSPNIIDKIVHSSKKVYNFRKVRPGQKFNIYSAGSGGIDSLEYFISRENILKIRRCENSFTAEMDTLPYEIIYKVTSGTINYSLFASLQAENADPELAGSLAVIFGWVIDFFKDIRNGDSYTILYEKKKYEDGVAELGRVLATRIITRGRPYYAFWFKGSGKSAGFYDLNGNSLQKTLLRAPLKFTRITSSFRTKRLHPVTHSYRPHLGVDYAAPYGTPVHATGDGTIVASHRNRANGNYIKIRHNRIYTTYYLHLSRFAKGIKEGRKVRQGQTIGYVGSTGLATGPHLDYRIKVSGHFVNPRTIKLPSKRPVSKKDIQFFRQQRDAALSRFFEAPVLETDGRTILVEKPALSVPGKMESLF